MLCVLMPAYNAEKYIAAAITSVFTQTRAIETRLLIVDDGSTDRTADVIRDLMSQYPEISLYQTENQGVSAARNHLISHLPPQASYVTFLDADDCLPIDRFARDIDILDADKSLDLVFGQMCRVSSLNPALRDVDTTQCEKFRSNNVAEGTYRKNTILENGPFDTAFTHGEDLDYLLRMFERRPNARLLNEVSVFYRRNPEGATSDRDALRKGVLRAILLHIRRLRSDPTLARVDTLFTQHQS